jgi:hypothetical protein
MATQVPRRTPRRKPSLRMQFALSMFVAAVFITALIIFVDTEGPKASEPVVSPNAVFEENREANILIGQDQMPHISVLKAGKHGSAALVAAIAAYFQQQVNRSILSGTLQHTGCSVAPGGTATRAVYHCSAIVANVTYPVDGVVDTAKRQVIFCKHDIPPVPGMNIPDSKLCT